MAYVRMRNINTGEIKFMPEATSRLATVLQRWVVEDTGVKKLPELSITKDAETIKETQKELDEAFAGAAPKTATVEAETAEEAKPTPNPKAKRKKAQPKK